MSIIKALQLLLFAHLCMYACTYCTEVTIHMITLALLCCCISVETFHTPLTLLSCGIVGAD